MPSSFASSIEQLIGGIFKFFVDFASQNAPFISRIFGSTIIIIKTIGIMTPVKMTIAQTALVFFKMGHSCPLFLYFCLFNTQLTVNKFLPTTGCEPRTSGMEATALPTEPHNHCTSNKMLVGKWLRLSFRAVTSDTTVPRFESGHRQTFIKSI